MPADTDLAAASALKDVLKELTRQLSPELAEILLPVVQLKSASKRLVALLPNPIWRDVFEEHAAEPARRVLSAQGLGLYIVCRQDIAARGGRADQRFDSFLQDPGNLVALTACRRVVEAPGLEHNPLYLHGAPGGGKSHLLSAIADEYRRMLDDDAVVEFTGPEFVAREAQQLSQRGTGELRTRIERAALILFDDIDALAHRALAQEELFHLINSCLDRGAQLVFAGSQAPRKLPGMEERLITRLAWGLAVAVEPPHAETRLALLRRLAGPNADGIEAAELARLIDTFAPDMHQVVRLAERLGEGERPGSAEAASFDRIVQAVAERYELRPGDIAGKRRHRAVAQARQIALLLGRRLTDHSLEALGGMVGGRDHATVLYSIRQAEERVVQDPDVAREVKELTQAILGKISED